MSDNWITKSTIYQIYPLTFRDGDDAAEVYKHIDQHYGDLQGIIEKLDYIQSLHADAIWLTPIFESPLADGFGYNVSDYKRIHGIFGEEDDFDRLVEQTHKRGIKVLLDMVFNHTSDQHHWFKESCKSKTGPYADYYVWADAQYDAHGNRQPPNNWFSMDLINPSAWEWNEEREQYYMHSFNVSMPDLNINNPAVQEELLDIARFWLERGVDGFRVDAVPHMGHDPGLRDNPIFNSDAGYHGQHHQFSTRQPSGQDFMRKLKAMLDQYPEKTLGGTDQEPFKPGLLGEVVGDTNYALWLVDTGAMDIAYSAQLSGNLYNFKQIIENALSNREDGKGINWAISGHDMSRVLDRAMGDRARPEHAALYTAMLAALPGSICLFQGQALGLRQSTLEEVVQHDQDPLGLTKSFMGEADASRAGIPWIDEANKDLWMAPAPINNDKALAHQEHDPLSPLNKIRKVLEERKTHPALQSFSKPEFIDSNDPYVMLFIRRDHETERDLICAYNFDTQAKHITIHYDNDDGAISSFELNCMPLSHEYAEHKLPDHGLHRNTMITSYSAPTHRKQPRPS